MRWNLTETNCPNCGNKTAKSADRGSESFYLICNLCGLCLCAEDKYWVVSNSYIDKTLIGKNIENIDAEKYVNEGKNENIIKTGSPI